MLTHLFTNYATLDGDIAKMGDCFKRWWYEPFLSAKARADGIYKLVNLWE